MVFPLEAGVSVVFPTPPIEETHSHSPTTGLTSVSSSLLQEKTAKMRILQRLNFSYFYFLQI